MRVGLVLRKNGNLNITYRDIKEYFEKQKEIIPTLETVRNAVVTIRKNKLPYPSPLGTVGSFFKNLVVSQDQFTTLKTLYPSIPGYPVEDSAVKIPLAWVLDTLCRVKGLRNGNVGVYEKQSLVLVHYGGGTAREVMDFSETLREKVKEKIGIKPEYEISFVGEF